MKTICYISKSFPHKSETFIVNQIVAAIKRDYHVLILTNNFLSINSSSQEVLFSKYSLVDKVRKIDFNISKNKVLKLFQLLILHAKYFKYVIKNVEMSARTRFIKLPFKIRFYEKFINVDTFHIQFGNAGFDIILMKKIGLIKSKFIITFHGYDAHWNGEVDFVRKTKLYKDVFKYCEIITCNSLYLKNKLVLLGCPIEKISIIPMGIDMDLFTPIYKEKKVVSESLNLVSVGRLIELKGHKYAIESIQKLVLNGYNIKYNIVGDGEQYNYLKKMIDELSLNGIVKLHGFKSQSEIREMLSNSDVFLMPSITDASGRGEAQGQVTAEAQAMGLPVVAFDSGGVSETIMNNESGILVTEKDINAFAEAIKSLLNNELLRIKMGETAQDFIKEKFNLKLNSELFFKLY